MQGVQLDRLVQVRNALGEGVETGAQLGSDDNELERIPKFTEPVEDRLLLLIGEPVRGN